MPIQSFGLQGALDLVTPPIQMPPGKVIAGVNYEPHPRGYRRFEGFERLDGRPRPSKQSYWLIAFDGGSTAILEDDIVTGATSGASGRVVVDAVANTGDWGSGNAAGNLVLTNVTGTFANNEALQVSSVTRATSNGLAVKRGADNDDDDATWLRSAIAKARADITAIPGSGAVRGVWLYKGDIYGFRDNAGATACVMHKATASGWTEQDLGHEISFDAGTSAFTIDSTLTGGTSGATGTIKRVIIESGSWSGNDAAGRIILYSVTGTFQDNETVTDAATGSATANGANSAQTLSAGGRYDFDNENFFGNSALLRMYGCNGLDRGFEWDGSVFVFIATGMATDTPIRVAAHRNHLFFAFPGGSNQHSGIGDPYAWTIISGAGEIAIGEEVTDYVPSVSGQLAIFGRNNVSVLFGTSSADWELRELSDDSGAVPWTAQMIGSPIYLDNVGLRSMDSTQNFGDFMLGTQTQMIEPLFEQKRIQEVSAVGALRVRNKDQYRLFYDDGTGISVYFGRQTPEILPFDIGKTPACFCSGKDTDGAERLLMGDDSGFVFELDAGTSFDGEEVAAYLRLPFNNLGTPERRKRFKKVTAEVDGGPNTNLGLTAEYGYADPEQPPSNKQLFDVKGSGGFWNEALWNNFYWSSPVEGQAEAHIDGMGRNVSVTIVSNATHEEPHLLHGIIFQFEYRGIAR